MKKAEPAMAPVRFSTPRKSNVESETKESHVANENRNPGQQGGPAQRDQQNQQDQQRREREDQNRQGNKDQQRNRNPQPGDTDDNRSGEQRPDALAPADGSVAHRLNQRPTGIFGQGQEAIERCVHLALDARERIAERARHGVSHCCRTGPNGWRAHRGWRRSSRS